MDDLPPYEQPVFEPPPLGGPLDSPHHTGDTDPFGRPQTPGPGPRPPATRRSREADSPKRSDSHQAHPAHSGGPPGHPGSSPPGGPARKRAGATCATLLVLVSCLIAVAGGAVAAVITAIDGEPGPGVESPPAPPVDPEAAQADRLLQWGAWAPPLGSDDTTPATARQRDIAERIVARILPDFAIYELLVLPGYYDEVQEYHVADAYYFRAADDTMEMDLAFYVYATSEHWAEAGIDWDEALVAEYRTLDSLADGTQFEFDTDAFAPAIGGIADPDYASLLAQVHRDWPDGVCVWAELDQSGTVATTYQTTWESYRDDRTFIGIQSFYELRPDGSWSMMSWDWYQD